VQSAGGGYASPCSAKLKEAVGNVMLAVLPGAPDKLQCILQQALLLSLVHRVFHGCTRCSYFAVRLPPNMLLHAHHSTKLHSHLCCLLSRPTLLSWSVTPPSLVPMHVAASSPSTRRARCVSIGMHA
jgi:hypothetical protein